MTNNIRKVFDAARVGASTGASENLSTVVRFFEALGAMDFDAIGAFFTNDGLYQDVPAPQADARGPEAVSQKLRNALAGLDGFGLRFSRVAASGDWVMSEREEDWHFPTGEVATIPVLGVHELRDGKITLWREYWNLPSLMAQMPQTWLEEMARRSQGGG
jgi:limonene-1,2-epoxide hydrolase